jgi:DNA-binding NarL/FixJ family response regulator
LNPRSILIIDKNYSFINNSIEFFAKRVGISLVTWAASYRDAIHKFLVYSPELVILDIEMNALEGTDLTGWFKNRKNAPSVMITSSYDNEVFRNFAKSVGADGFINKVNYHLAYPELLYHFNSEFEKIIRDYKYHLN